MKFLLLLVPFILNAWSFKISDLRKYSPQQLEVLEASYNVGYSADLSWSLMAIAIVENRARMTDSNPNSICGPHQVSEIFSEATCESLESNPYVSATAALRNLQYWLKQTKGNLGQALKHYNGGWYTHKHGHEYLRRIRVTLNVLKKHETEVRNLIFRN